MDDRGWTKTKRGRVVYRSDRHFFTDEDIERIKLKQTLPDEELSLWDLLANFFEQVVVERFANLPFVQEIWFIIRFCTRAEFELGRPMNVEESMQAIIKAVFELIDNSALVSLVRWFLGESERKGDELRRKYLLRPHEPDEPAPKPEW